MIEVGQNLLNYGNGYFVIIVTRPKGGGRMRLDDVIVIWKTQSATNKAICHVQYFAGWLSSRNI